MNHFVTGLHRAGTHSLAANAAKKEGLPWLAEERIGYNSLEAVVKLTEGWLPIWKENDVKFKREERLDMGFVLQCPRLAHKTLELAKYGKVYWAKRNVIDTVTSMKNGGLKDVAWKMMRGFREEFPKDPIWDVIHYDGSEDNHYGFVGFQTLLVCVEDYFLNEHFKNVCKTFVLEDQPHFDAEKMLAKQKPLRVPELKRVKKVLKEYNESIRVLKNKRV